MATDSARRGPPGVIALRGVMMGVVGVALAYASAFASGAPARMGPWIMALSMPLVLVSIMALGAARGGPAPRGFRVTLILTYLSVAGGLVLGLALPADAPNAPLWWGLPRRAFLVLAGAGVLPLVGLPVVFARLFPQVTLRARDLERVREAARKAAREAAGEAAQDVLPPQGS